MGRDDRRNGGGKNRRRNSRAKAAEEEGGGGGYDGGDQIVCTGRAFKSCTAGVIADCVAVCCCPCAVVDILVLTLFKVPWILLRKCLRFRRKNRSEANSRIGSVQVSALGIESSSSLSVLGKDNLSARFEAEEVWLELYQVGHLGFGRVSFTEIPSQI